MTQKITRKDFLNGVSLAIGAALLPPRGLLATTLGPDPTSKEYFLSRGINQNDPRYYPPGLTGMRGSHPGAFETAHAMRDGEQWQAAGTKDLKEKYDLIVAGGGISGLSAAYFYKKRNPQAKILVLDNHDDFGGHAKRNEFRNGSIIGFGGTQEIEGWPDAWSPQAKELLKDLGIEPERFEKEFYETEFNKQHGLRHGVFFEREAFGADATANDVGLPTWEAFAERTPLSPKARADLVRFQTQKVDYLPGVSIEEKVAKLRKLPFEVFLRDYVKVDPQVIAYFRTFMSGGFGCQIDVMPTLMALRLDDFLSVYWGGQQGPTNAAFQGLGLQAEGGMMGGKPPTFVYYHFPDGNASIARMLVRKLIPGCAPGSTMEDIVKAKMDYTRLDQPGSNVRIRLNSTAVRVGHLGDPSSAKEVSVSYVTDGRAYSVRSSTCILACYNMVIPYLCPEMPQQQRAALHMGVKVPLVYANAQLRRWSSLKKLGLSMIYCPTSYFSEIYMDFPISMGGYHYTQSPDEPVVLHMVRVPCKPGMPTRQQRRMGRLELYTTPFETFEHQIRDQLQRMLGPGGFDANRDLEAITVNRWPHGYADYFNDIEDPEYNDENRPNVIGRKQFGRISIANTDAGAEAETYAAIAQGYRAFDEISRL